MKVGFFSDPHLGITRATNTTVHSRAALREEIYQRTLGAIEKLKEAGCGRVYCLGDLFDTFSNDEKTILQGARVTDLCDGTLEGNHDRENRADSIGSLELLKRIGATQNIISGAGYVAQFFVHEIGQQRLVFVPHTMTQQLFCEALDSIIERFKEGQFADNFLCLHCNVDVPGYAEASDRGTTLYLTDAYQEKLLRHFNMILVGHEHVPRASHGGRVQLLGNVFPLAFGELADRYAYILDTETGTLVDSIKLFDMETEYAEIPISDFLATQGQIDVSASIVQIVGQVRATDSADLARALSTFWKQNESLLLVRNATTIQEVSKASRHENSFVPKTLPELVSESVANTPYSEAYEEAVQAVKESKTDL